MSSCTLSHTRLVAVPAAVSVVAMDSLEDARR